MFPAVCPPKFVDVGRARILEHYGVPHFEFVVRTRVLCQAGRAIAAACVRGDVVALMCRREPLWVVVHACALLRDAV